MDASERLDAPRIALVAPEDMNAEQRELLGVDLEAGEPGQAGLSLFQLVVLHPEVLRRLKATGSFANRMTQISDRDRELMILRISWLYRSEFEWGQHYAQALDAGVTVDDAERVKDGPEAGGWNEWDRALLVATDGLVSDCMIPTPAWEVLRSGYSPEVLLEFVVFFGHYTMVSMFANTFGLGVAPGRPGFDGEIVG
ncbi:MAG: carboxymuconolactone decarboxylase family protein [Acidimicrobiaceae bacterium]|nr:carboxymuconolactone decarboxylase family protein [Acidimicrobiaceae bacterium]